MTNEAQIILSLLGGIVAICAIGMLLSKLRRKKSPSISDTCSCTSAPEDCCVVSDVDSQMFINAVADEEKGTTDTNVEVEFLKPEEIEDDHDDEEPYLLTDEVILEKEEDVKPIESENDPELVNPFLVAAAVMEIVHMNCIYCDKEIIRGAEQCFNCKATYYYIDHWKGGVPLSIDIYNKVVYKLDNKITKIKDNPPVDMKALQEIKQRQKQWNKIHEELLR